MALTFVKRDGQRLTPYMLYQINKLDNDCYAKWNVHIVVTSGIRAYDEQKTIFLQRYVTAANINGRKVYDVRTWNGVTYYRISSAGTVAVPGTSNHEIQGTRGAVDIHDTGADAGITVKSSARGQWIRQVCGNYGMEATGDGFGEGWHFEFLNVGNAIPGAGGGGANGSMTDLDKQNFLNSLGYNTGSPGWGPMCEAATKDFQGKVGLIPDGVFGPKTETVANIIKGGGNYIPDKKSTAEIQKKLTDLGFPVGTVDNQWGNKTSFGTYRFQLTNKLVTDGQFGQASYNVAWPTPVTPDPTPTPPTPEVVPGRNATTRPNKDIQKALSVPETNIWDKLTSEAVRRYQQSKFIMDDYIYGGTTDGFLFPPANFGFGVDYSFSRPDLQMLKDRGTSFIARYLWKEKYDDGIRINKGLSKAEYDNARSKNLQVVFIYEEDGKELLGGTAAGIRVATEAEKYRTAQGLPAQPIYFNVDYNAPTEDLTKIIAALKGVAQVIGLNRVGLYAGYSVIKAAFDTGVITYGMQTYAWSNGQWDGRAQLRQWSNGQWNNQVDFQYAMASEFGQSAIVTPDPGPDPTPDPDPGFVVTKEELLKQRAAAAGLVDFFDNVLKSTVT